MKGVRNGEKNIKKTMVKTKKNRRIKGIETRKKWKTRNNIMKGDTEEKGDEYNKKYKENNQRNKLIKSMR